MHITNKFCCYLYHAIATAHLDDADRVAAAIQRRACAARPKDFLRRSRHRARLGKRRGGGGGGDDGEEERRPTQQPRRHGGPRGKGGDRSILDLGGGGAWSAAAAAARTMPSAPGGHGGGCGGGGGHGIWAAMGGPALGGGGWGWYVRLALRESALSGWITIQPSDHDRTADTPTRASLDRGLRAHRAAVTRTSDEGLRCTLRSMTCGPSWKAAGGSTCR